MRTDLFELAGSLDFGEGRSSAWALEAGPNPEGGLPQAVSLQGFAHLNP